MSLGKKGRQIKSCTTELRFKGILKIELDRYVNNSGMLPTKRSQFRQRVVVTFRHLSKPQHYSLIKEGLPLLLDDFSFKSPSFVG